MTTEENALIFHTATSKHSNLLIDLDKMRSVGIVRIELGDNELEGYIDADCGIQDLRKILSKVYASGMDFLVDIELPRKTLERPLDARGG